MKNSQKKQNLRLIKELKLIKHTADHLLSLLNTKDSQSEIDSSAYDPDAYLKQWVHHNLFSPENEDL